MEQESQRSTARYRRRIHRRADGLPSTLEALPGEDHLYWSLGWGVANHTPLWKGSGTEVSYDDRTRSFSVNGHFWMSGPLHECWARFRSYYYDLDILDLEWKDAGSSIMTAQL